MLALLFYPKRFFNKLLKQFDDMSVMMKRMSKMGQKGMMRGGLASLMPGLGNKRPF
jgi:signal recognition particle subunit SRP54